MRVFTRAPVLAIVPERHLICIFSANVLHMEIFHFPWIVKYIAEVSTLRTTELQGRVILLKDGGLTGKEHWLCQELQVLGYKIHWFSTYLLSLYKMSGTDMGTGDTGPCSHILEGGILVAKMQPLPSLSSKLEKCWDFWQEQGEMATILAEGTGFRAW